MCGIFNKNKKKQILETSESRKSGCGKLLISEPKQTNNIHIKFLQFGFFVGAILLTILVSHWLLITDFSNFDANSDGMIFVLLVFDILFIGGSILFIKREYIDDILRIYDDKVCLPSRRLIHVIYREQYFVKIEDITAVSIEVEPWGNIAIIFKHNDKVEPKRYINSSFDYLYSFSNQQLIDYSISVLKVFRDHNIWSTKAIINNNTKLEIENVEDLIEYIEERGDIHELLVPKFR